VEEEDITSDPNVNVCAGYGCISFCFPNHGE